MTVGSDVRVCLFFCIYPRMDLWYSFTSTEGKGAVYSFCWSISHYCTHSFREGRCFRAVATEAMNKKIAADGSSAPLEEEGSERLLH